MNKTEKKNSIFLGTYNDIEYCFKDNEYIKKGYLINVNTNFKALKSLFMLNNESVNVWSHLLGAFFLLIIIFYTAIFITNYNTQIFFIKSNLREIKETISFNENNYYIDRNFNYNNNININSNNNNAYMKRLIKIISELQCNFTIFDFKKFYNYSYYSLNNAYEELIISTKNRLNNITDGIYGILDQLKEKFLSLQDKMLYLMELESIPLIKKKKKEAKNTKIKRWPLFVFLLSAIICLSFSATFHLIGKVSKTQHSILSRFDYAGIALLISGSCYSPYYYFFNCEKNIRNAYLTFITVFGVLVFFSSLTKNFHLPKNRKFRGILFLIFGISAGIPIVHIYLFGDSVMGLDKGLSYANWFYGGISYIIGALLYIIRFPERAFPGKVDFFGASHQLFHCLVLAGVAFHYLGCLDAYYYRFENVCMKS